MNPVFFMEFGLFTGAALVWAGYEIWSVRKALREPDQTDKDRTSPSEEPAGHAER